MEMPVIFCAHYDLVFSSLINVEKKDLGLFFFFFSPFVQTVVFTVYVLEAFWGV